MPAICNNVRAVEGPGFQRRVLVYDKNDNLKRIDSRRDNTCPDTKSPGNPKPKPWKRLHVCPEVNQPGVISKQGGPRRPGRTDLADAFRPRTDEGAYEIAIPVPPVEPAQKASGLRYSCDEYPFASSVCDQFGEDIGLPALVSSKEALDLQELHRLSHLRGIHTALL